MNYLFKIEWINPYLGLIMDVKFKTIYGVVNIHDSTQTNVNILTKYRIDIGESYAFKDYVSKLGDKTIINEIKEIKTRR